MLNKLQELLFWTTIQKFIWWRLNQNTTTRKSSLRCLPTNYLPRNLFISSLVFTHSRYLYTKNTRTSKATAREASPTQPLQHFQDLWMNPKRETFLLQISNSNTCTTNKQHRLQSNLKHLQPYSHLAKTKQLTIQPPQPNLWLHRQTDLHHNQ